MSTFIGIIAILFIIAFFKRILMGIFGAIIFGLLGSLFGHTAGTIGMVIGFLAGFGSQIDESKETEESVEFENNTNQNDQNKKHETKPEYQNTKTSNTCIVRCPTCMKKIRVQLPLQGKKGKCVACSSPFYIRLVNGQVRVEAVTRGQRSNSNERASSILDCYKILEINENSSPDEVRVAYKKKIRLYHPDRVSGLGEKLKRMANEESKLINTAYSMLKAKGLTS